MTHAAEAPKGRVLGYIVSLDANRGRGFGFIHDPDSGNEYFMHRTNCAPQLLFDQLRDGDAVSFHWMPSPKGPKAVDVQRATDEEKIQIQADVALTQEDDRNDTRGNR